MTHNILHATAIVIAGNGVLFVGPSGSGKSDLALRLIDRGATLLSDDAVLLDSNHSPALILAAPNIEGRLEVRNVGIATMPYSSSAPLRLVVDLGSAGDRLPAENLSREIGGFLVPLACLNSYEASAAIKVEYALRLVVDGGRWPVASSLAGRPERIAN